MSHGSHKTISLLSSKECKTVRVRNTLASLALMLSLTGLANAQGGGAQPTAQPAAGTRVGVVDIGYIFENHPTMPARIEAVNAEVKKSQESIDAKRNGLLKELEQMKELSENSPAFKQKEEAFAASESALKLDFVRKDKEFAEKKALIVYESYKEVEALTRKIATDYQFGIVILANNSRTEMDPKKPMTVQAGMNKDVVYVSENLDLTLHVLAQLQQNAPASAAPAPKQPGAQANVPPTGGNIPRSAQGNGPTRKQ